MQENMTFCKKFSYLKTKKKIAEITAEGVRADVLCVFMTFILIYSWW